MLSLLEQLTRRWKEKKIRMLWLMKKKTLIFQLLPYEMQQQLEQNASFHQELLASNFNTSKMTQKSQTNRKLPLAHLMIVLLLSQRRRNQPRKCELTLCHCYMSRVRRQPQQKWTSYLPYPTSIQSYKQVHLIRFPWSWNVVSLIFS